MKSYSRSAVTDPTLLRDLSTHLSQERAGMAEVLADLAEIDARGLYRAQGYPSMFAFCVGSCHFTDQAAFKRIHVARVARSFPAIFGALADGRVHMTAVELLATHLTDESVEDLLRAATHKTKFEIEQLLAERFPRPDLPTYVSPLPSALELSPERVPEAPPRLSPERVVPAPRARTIPLSAERVALQVTVDRSTHEKIRRAHDLLGYRVGSDELAQVLDRALDALIEKLEKRKLGASDKPRRRKHESKNPRHIPAHVRRAVHERDGGRCTFVADSGHRCEARRGLEYDHIEPVARGGRSIASNLRLRCRAHNQLEAEQAFGKSLIQARRQQARDAARKKRAEEIVPWLRALGIRADHAAQVAERCGPMTGASLEERVKAALRHFGPRDVCLGRAAPA